MTVASALTVEFEVLVAVIVAVPSPTAFTVPFVTVATAAFEVDHVTALLAPEGVAVTVKVWLAPTVKLSEEGFIVSPVTVVEELPEPSPHIASAYSGWSMKGFLLP